MYAEALSILKSELAAVPRTTTSGTTGITTFIRDELIADGGKRPAVTPPPGGFPKHNASAKGKANGRRFDSGFQDSVCGRHANVDVVRAVKALRSAGVVPLKCQHRVVTQNNMLTTLVDAVGISTTAPFSPVCIELKTCQLRLNVYRSYSTAACRRTPLLRCTPQLANTERNKHYLQAAYGAIGLAQQLGRTVRAVVLVNCRDGPLVLEVPQTHMLATRFVRLPHISAFRKNRALEPPKRRQKQETVKMHLNPWPTCSTALLQSTNLSKATRQLATRTWAVLQNQIMIGTIVHVPRWTKLNRITRERILLHCRTASRHRVAAARPLITPLILTPLTRGGDLQLIVGGQTFPPS